MSFKRALVVVLAVSWLGGCMTPSDKQAEQERRQRLASTHTQLGISYMQRGQSDIAKDEFRKALDAEPDNPEITNMMALLLFRLREFDEAEKYFRRATEGKGNPGAWNNYGIFLCERGRYGEADTAFLRALTDKTYKTPAEANVNAGMCQMRKPAPAAAERFFRAALDLNPKQPRALVEMARISFNAGRTISARAFMQRYFEVGEDRPEVLLLATRIERVMGNHNAEASYAMRLTGKFPDSPEVTELKKDTSSGGKNSGKATR